MSNTKHTPGPWKIEDEKNQFAKWQFIEDGKGNTICEMPIHKSEKGNYPFVIANAKLISAAPELLEALYIYIHKLPIGILTDEELNIINTAIKKATE